MTDTRSSDPRQLERYLTEVGCEPLLSADDELALGWSIINDDCAYAREALFRANKRLVVAIAAKYTARGLPLSILIEAGNAGLRRGVNDFDPAFGARFSTTASWWIKQAILRAMHEHSQRHSYPSCA